MAARRLILPMAWHAAARVTRSRLLPSAASGARHDALLKMGDSGAMGVGVSKDRAIQRLTALGPIQRIFFVRPRARGRAPIGGFRGRWRFWRIPKAYPAGAPNHGRSRLLTFAVRSAEADARDSQKKRLQFTRSRAPLAIDLGWFIARPALPRWCS